MSPSAIQLQIDHVLAELSIVRDRVATLESRMSGIDGPLAAEVADLKRRISALEDTVTNLKASVAELTAA